MGAARSRGPAAILAAPSSPPAPGSELRKAAVGPGWDRGGPAGGGGGSGSALGPQRRTGTEGLGGSVRCPKETRRAAVSAARPAAPCGEPRRFVPRRKGRDGPRGSGNGMGGLMIAQRRSKSAPDRSDPRGSAVTPKWGFGSIGAHWGPLGALGPFGGIGAVWRHWGRLEAFGPAGALGASGPYGDFGAIGELWGC